MPPSDRRHNKIACRRLLGLVVACPTATVAGCLAIEPRPSFDSAFAPDRFLAIQRAHDTRDTAAIDDLIRQLSDDDLLLRWAANDALIDLTEQDHGFRPDDDEADRREAIGRWVAWRATDADQAGDPR